MPGVVTSSFVVVELEAGEYVVVNVGIVVVNCWFDVVASFEDVGLEEYVVGSLEVAVDSCALVDISIFEDGTLDAAGDVDANFVLVNCERLVVLKRFFDVV